MQETCTIEATVPTGFESVAADEAKEVFNTDCRAARGKIVFKSPVESVKDILNLGGIDHCRIQILHKEYFEFSSSGDDCLVRLQLLVKECDWTSGLNIWSKFVTFDHPVSSQPEQEFTDEELKDICYSSHMPGNRKRDHGESAKEGGKKDRRKGRGGKGRGKGRGIEGDNRRGGNRNINESEANPNPSKDDAQEPEDSEVKVSDEPAKEEATEPESGSDKTIAVDPTDAGDCVNVNRVTEHDAVTGDKGDEAQATEETPANGHVKEPVSPKKTRQTTDRASGQMNHEESSDPSKDQSEHASCAGDTEVSDPSKTDDVESSVDPEKEQEDIQSKPPSACSTSNQAEEGKGKKPRKEKAPRDPTKPTFRITCKRSGDYHSFDSMSAAASLGSSVQKYFGWNVDMEKFDIEVVITIDNQEVSVGLALTPESLHKRNLVAFGVTTLRPTVCHNMLRMVKVMPGHIVCDPLCGTGSISIQGALRFPALQMCGDNHHIAMEKCHLNMDAMNKKRITKGSGGLMMDALRWSVCYLPLRDGIVDVFVSDLPFGKRVGRKFDNRKLYCSVLDEMARCSKPAGRAALLTGDITNMTKAIIGQRYWTRRRVYNCNIGGISAAVFLLFRERLQYLRKPSAKTASSTTKSQDQTHTPPQTLADDRSTGPNAETGSNKGAEAEKDG